ncbi:hypothetical protein [Flagellimonas aquimarina]|uniref:hypothetical protein n=1 Tax=Flagellimonas aquimarina TaxID=2201895 RepID=UPI001403109B|nr:hypothetical protein [Allomuricauda koreensis]
MEISIKIKPPELRFFANERLPISRMTYKKSRRIIIQTNILDIFFLYAAISTTDPKMIIWSAKFKGLPLAISEIAVTELANINVNKAIDKEKKPLTFNAALRIKVFSII